MIASKPSVLGLRKSFGYGDHIGLAGPGHIASSEKSDFAPVFAQQSVRDLNRTNRTPLEVIKAAQEALNKAKYSKPWGAEADHLKTREDVFLAASAGYTCFTIDSSLYINNAADEMTEFDLKDEISSQVLNGIYGGEQLDSLYLGKPVIVEGTGTLTFDTESLYRAAVKYGRAIAHFESMAGHVAKAMGSKDYEIEVSIDESESPTSALEHLFIALELERRAVKIVSLAPHFTGEFEKGIDFRGNMKLFESTLAKHVGIAKSFGPYKLSVYSGSDKFAIYPIIGRVCGDLLHIKTAGTSYLEALRVVCRMNQDLFLEIACYSAGRFPIDVADYHISTTEDDIRNLGHEQIGDIENIYLNQDVGRQMLHVTFGSVLTMGESMSGQPFKEAIIEILQSNPDLYQEVLETHFTKHLNALCHG
ncbi:MAG: hypothetical protein DF168_00455 [Candidatus Moanabacter tarae]|uniref:Tagaturonate/fructuronate epimerase n=1 Tax=Candidatus Moanibacter tarae TaxID=2200854 RepID=A0A2Z4AGK6_9BACT|nr:MAG: hypothetical protein DF168_00455 [Candidatus Moanabacter tarae]|tara:strand:+ start:5643 stop:6899 length:1257 start_codon:yes stop_codon:yes gene_type:complete